MLSGFRCVPTKTCPATLVGCLIFFVARISVSRPPSPGAYRLPASSWAHGSLRPSFWGGCLSPIGKSPFRHPSPSRFDCPLSRSASLPDGFSCVGMPDKCFQRRWRCRSQHAGRSRFALPYPAQNPLPFSGRQDSRLSSAKIVPVHCGIGSRDFRGPLAVRSFQPIRFLRAASGRRHSPAAFAWPSASTYLPASIFDAGRDRRADRPLLLACSACSCLGLRNPL